MEKRRLGKTDFEITPIGLGCMQFAGHGMVERMYPSLEQQTVTSVVRTALDNGVNWFDTAEMYGHGRSERSLTTALQELGPGPGEVTIATKWVPTFRTASSIGRTIGDRLTALQGYPIDLHQIHMPYGGFSSIPSQVVEMAKLCRDGKISSVGVSNFSATQMEKANDVLRAHGLALTSNQVQLNLLRRNVERDGVLETARRLGITLIAFSPLRSGLLTGRFHEDPDRLASVPRLRRMIGGFNAKTLARTAPLVDELRAIGTAYGASVSQIALAWLVNFYGDIVVAIPGASKPRQAEDNAGAMDIRLTSKELDRLDELSKPFLAK